MIAASERPARAAAVANPARSECTAKSPSSPAAAARAATISASARSDDPISPARIAVPIDPAKDAPRADRRGFEPAAQRPDRTSRRIRADRNRYRLAGPFAIGLRAPNRQHDPSSSKPRSPTSSVTSSLRRRAAAQPTSRSARSRSPRRFRRDGQDHAAERVDLNRGLLRLRQAELAAGAAHDGALRRFDTPTGAIFCSRSRRSAARSRTAKSLLHGTSLLRLASGSEKPEPVNTG
jgi:hypothetical protein